MGKAAATAAMSAFLWGAPSMVAEKAYQNSNAALTQNPFVQSTMVSAKDKASATGSRVNKDAESLLRLGLPIKSKEVRIPQLAGPLNEP